MRWPLGALRSVAETGLPPSARLVLVAYVLRSDNRTRTTWAGCASVADWTGQSERSVRRHRLALLSTGFLQDTGRRRSRAAVLRVCLPHEVDPTVYQEVLRSLRTPDPGSGLEDLTPDPRSATPDPRSADTGPTVRLSAHDLPIDLPNTQSTGGQKMPKEQELTLTPPQLPLVEPTGSPEASVLAAWTKLWTERVQAWTGRGKPPGYPRKPRKPGHPDGVGLRRCLAQGRTPEDLELVARWAFLAPSYHARLLRGEVDGGGAVHLGLPNLYRPTKLGAKLAKAEAWEDSGSPTQSGSASSGYWRAPAAGTPGLVSSSDPSTWASDEELASW